MSAPVLSVCIVTYRAKDLLRDCLQSLCANTNLPFEVIIVDNGSQDGAKSMLEREFPAFTVIENNENLGFTFPMNQALRLAQGQYLLQLNPDTLILPDSLDKMVAFMNAHPDIGICGPKVLNRNQTLQKSCRRGEPTPWAVLTYFLGFSARYPKSKLFGQYQMNYMDEDLTHPVAGVSGSCMLIRRELIDDIGYLDERFFAYQEDADFCLRARQAGWQVYYYPGAEIIHYGGQGGSRVEPYRSILAWHKSYFIYYRKHLAKNYFFLFNWIYYLAMILKLGLSLAENFIRKEKIVSARRP
jgi:hypothetical protein